jgi:hypothetical protein
MSFRENLRESDEYQEIAGAAEESAEQAAQTAGTVVELEKSDVQFWTDVLTVVLLFLIWQELRRQGGGAR